MRDVNSKVAALALVLFAISAPVDIIYFILYIFKDKNLNKKYLLKNGSM
jgi:hypothetical protein